MTSIEWTDTVWNPVVGCSRVSAGCQNCYAERVAHRGMQDAHKGLTVLGAKGPRWTGEVRTMPARLGEPLRWRKPRRVFVNSMSDIFHEKVPFEFVAAVFGVMAACPQHTFQCLTKRPARMREFLSHPEVEHWVAQARDAALVDAAHEDRERWASIEGFPRHEVSSHGSVRADGQLLATTCNPRTGREQVTLWGPDGGKTLPVHRLVLLAFVPQPTSYHEVCHRNGDKRDNRLANLRWGTRSENQQDKVRHGKRGGPAKIDARQADEIRRARAGGETQQRIADRYGISRSLVSMIESGRVWGPPNDPPWPLPNVWVGVSVEDQAAADERIPLLLECPAAVRWVSAEPLLGPVDLGAWVDPWSCSNCGHFDSRDNSGPVMCDECDVEAPYVAEHGSPQCPNCKKINGQHDCVGDTCPKCGSVECWSRDNGYCFDADKPSQLDWVVVGGESGPGARPYDVAWARSIIAQCRDAGVPVFHKQLGARPRDSVIRWVDPDGLSLGTIHDRKGGDPSEWPEDLRVREWPKAVA